MSQRLPDLPQKHGDRGLAAGAGDGGKIVPAGGKKARRGKREGAAHIGDLDERWRRQVQAPERALGNDHASAARDRILRIGEPIGLVAGHSEKHRILRDCAAVGAEAGNRPIGQSRIETDIRHEIAEPHQWSPGVAGTLAKA